MDVDAVEGVRKGEIFLIGDQECSVTGFEALPTGYALDFWAYGCAHIEVRATLNCDPTEGVAVRKGTVFPTVYEARQPTAKELTKASKALAKTAAYKEFHARAVLDAAGLARPMLKETTVQVWTGDRDLWEVRTVLKTGDDYLCGGDDAYDELVGWFDAKGRPVLAPGSQGPVSAVYDFGLDGSFEFEELSGNPYGRRLSVEEWSLESTDGMCMCGC